MPSDFRKKELLIAAQLILTNVIDPDEIKAGAGSIFGPESLAAEIQNRIELVAKTPDDYKYLVDAVSILILQSKDKEVTIKHKGRVLTDKDLAERHGIFVSLKKRKPNVG
jgi:hypothetical protein